MTLLVILDPTICVARVTVHNFDFNNYSDDEQVDQSLRNPESNDEKKTEIDSFISELREAFMHPKTKRTQPQKVWSQQSQHAHRQSLTRKEGGKPHDPLDTSSSILAYSLAHCILGFTPMCMPKISKRSKSFEVCE